MTRSCVDACLHFFMFMHMQCACRALDKHHAMKTSLLVLHGYYYYTYGQRKIHSTLGSRNRTIVLVFSLRFARWLAYGHR